MNKHYAVAFAPLALVAICLIFPILGVGLGDSVICGLWMAMLLVSLVATIFVKGRLRLVPLMTLILVLAAPLIATLFVQMIFEGLNGWSSSQ